jgi:hypothetical protein
MTIPPFHFPQDWCRPQGLVLNHSLHSITKFLIAAWLIDGASAMGAQCLSYSGEITLQGVLSRHTFPEQPNYENIANGDAKATYFFISPKQPLCVVEGAMGQGERAVGDVKRVQLVFMGVQDSYGPLRKFLGREVVCRGSLFPAISGHHHSPVLLSGAKCDAVQ